MCGIVGYADVASYRIDADFLTRAANAMSHRGPDGAGEWHDDHCGLGHRRLSIIDVTGGAQPMSYADGRYWITFNGEIYNYRELRGRLAGLGHRFATASDTEVILAAYAQWGSAAPEYLRGIFAFGIWDRFDQVLFLARDHVGVKPLFFCCASDRILFASELKALLIFPLIERHIDAQALSDYLALGYVLGSKTIVRGISRLAPGTTLTWRNGRVTVRRFWDLAAITEAPSLSYSSLEDCPREYRDRLEAAVAAQMVSDVPIGAFLSGGIDSSSLAYHMGQRTTAGLLKTFSMGFAEPSFSELEYAEAVARALHTDHYAELITDNLADSLPQLVKAFDEPLGDTSIVPTYFVSRLASKHVKVVLSGDGADETLAGYDTYVADTIQRLYRRVPAGLHNAIIRPLARLVPDSRRKVSFSYKLKQFIAEAHADERRAHFGWRLLFPEIERRALLGGAAPGHDPFDEYSAHFDEVPKASALNRSLYVDLKTWLVDNILVKLDRASMSVGIEARVPFLDLDLLEFTMRLPPSMKLRGLARKVVLRKAMRGRLPDMVLRRRKRGFNAPVSDWMCGPLRSLVDDLLQSTGSCVDVHHRSIQTLWKRHRARKADYGFRLWALISLIVWEREVLRLKPVPEARALARTTA